MNDNSKTLLSICIPTYNRGYMLNDFFKLLNKSVSGMEDKIEILVSNNNSSDNTSQVCCEWERVFAPKISFRYFVQEVNIGAVKNVTFLLGMSTGKYFMFIGDDDYINGSNLLRVMELLQSNENPSAIIQGKWNTHHDIKAKGFRSYLDAAQLFYEYGNAYAAIVDRQAAQEILSNDFLRSQIEESVWPQTAFGFLAMHSQKDRPIFITDYTIGGPIRDCQIVANKSYWVGSLHGLLWASFLIDREVGFNWVKKTFVRFRVSGFRNHVQAIIKYGIISENSVSTKTKKILRDHFGLRGFGWALVLELSDYQPKLMYIFAIIAFSILRQQSPLAVKKKIEEERKKYLENIKAAELNGKRTKDFF